MQLAAFRAAGSGGDTTPPSAPSGLTATAASSSQINLNWTASTDNVGVTGYRVERCQGAGCTTFTQIGTPTTTSYSDTGLTAGTSYSYRVRATDSAGNLSGYSSTASTSTSSGDAQPPTVPAGLTVLASSSIEVDLAWAASTDNVGVTGYLIERCTGSGCSSFAQIGTSTAPPYYDPALSPSTAYSYRVRATDAAGNFSAYSNVISATTPASSPDCN
jgi:chitodextrinase